MNNRPSPAPLAQVQIKAKLENCLGWSLEQKHLQKAYTFKDFSTALAAIVQIGIVSERLDHHARITNVYNKLELEISTHQPAGISELDFEWIRQAELALG